MHACIAMRFRLGNFLLFVLLLIQSCVASKTSLYDTLGVSKSCSGNDLKKAYRRKALKHHPDKVPPEKREKAQEKFKEIQSAYEILQDDEKRARYDQYGDAALDPNFDPHTPHFSSSSSPPPFSSHSFHQFSQQQEMPDLYSFFQQQQQQQQPGRQSSQFSSFGSASPFGMTNIDIAELLRQMTDNDSRNAPPSSPQQQQSRSKQKRQKSYTRNVYCSLEELAAGATKRLRVAKELYTIQLQPGWKAGTRVTFPPRRQNPNEMTFILQEKPHSFLKRQGNDLHYACTLTSRQAERGAKIKIPLPTGDTLELQTRPHTHNGHVMTIPNRGMPIKGTTQRGNLKIEFKVMEQSSHA